MLTDVSMDGLPDSSGNVFVTDFSNDRIQKFTNTGKFIRMWGSEGSASIDVTGADHTVYF
jgi:hypothetical protein